MADDRLMRTARREKRAIEEADDRTPGLYQVAQPSGSRSWVYRYRNPVNKKAAKLTLGRAVDESELAPGEMPRIGGALTVDHARILVGIQKLVVKAGRDPREDCKPTRIENLRSTGPTVDNVFVRFLNDYPAKRGGGAIRESTKLLNAGYLGLKRGENGAWVPTGHGVLAHWAGREFSSLTKQDAYDLLNKIRETAPVSANRTFPLLRLLAWWANEHGIPSPLDSLSSRSGKKSEVELNGVTRRVDQPRDRVLSEPEIIAFVRAALSLGYPQGHAALFVLLTMQRPGECRDAARSEIDLARRTWRIPAERTKANREQNVFLTDTSLAFLKSLPRHGEWLFMEPDANAPIVKQQKTIMRLNKLTLGELQKSNPRAKLSEPFTLHDLRRTGYDWMKQQGILEEVRRAVVNHSLRGLDRTYGPSELVRQKRAALEHWDAYLRGIVGKSALKQIAEKVKALPAPEKSAA